MTGIVIGGALLLGVLFRDAGASWPALPLALAIGALVVTLRTTWGTALLVAFSLGAAGLGYWHAATPVADAPTAEFIHATQFEGVIRDVPRQYPSHTRATVELRRPEVVTISTLLPHHPMVAQGDVIVFTGRVIPSSIGRQGPVAADVTSRRLFIVGNEASTAQRWRTRIVHEIVDRVERAVPQPAGALTAGMLTGDDGSMTATTRNAFRATGLTHITAVSGWHVAVVAIFVTFLGRSLRLPRGITLAFTLLVIWSFTYLVGLVPSATRSALMVTLTMAALWRGRPRDAATALIWSAAVMILAQPIIRFDIGFQLSVAATAGLIAVMPWLHGRSWWLIPLAVPVAAEVAVAPLLLYHFGQYSLVSPLTNAIVAPLLTPVMLVGTAVVIASFVHPLAAEVAGILAWIPARLVVAVAEWNASLPGAYGLMPQLSWGAMIVSYLLLGLGYAGISWYRSAELAPGDPADSSPVPDAP